MHDHYAKNLGKKATVIARLSNFTSIKQKRVLPKYFIESQLNYRRLIWMFHCRGLNNKINHLHKPSPRIVHKDSSSFKDPLKKSNCLLFIIEAFNHLPWTYSRLKRMFRIQQWTISYKLVHGRIFKVLDKFSDKFATSRVGHNLLGYFASKVWCGI